MRADLFTIPFEHLKRIFRSAGQAAAKDHMYGDEGAKTLYRHDMHNGYDENSFSYLSEDLLNNDCI